MARNRALYNGTRSVCMLVTTDMVNDPRVARHSESLGAHDFKVTVVCPISEKTEPHEFRMYYEIIRPRSIIREALSRLTARRHLFSVNSDAKIASQRDHAWCRLMDSASSFLVTQLSLLRTARKQNAQVYCANDFDTLLAAILAAGLDRILVYDSHELWPDMMLAPEPVKVIARSIEKVLIRRADFVMTVNEFIATELATRYSLKRVPQVVYNCPRRSLLKSYKRRTSLKIALYQGLYAPQRGLENLVKAADYLLPDIRLVLRGYGVIEQELRSLSTGRKNVRFDTPVKMSELVSAASRADVGLIPYLPTNLCNYLASPNKLFEYIQAGLPVVASDIPFMRKLILENDIGMLFDARDPRSMADAINRSTRSRVIRRQRANVASVATRYNWEIESEKLLKSYASLR
ncbi:MAG: glycosyltransferase [Candidatus Bathyarchaeia archaeon]